MQVIVIKQVTGLIKGASYQVTGANARDRVVYVKDDNGGTSHLRLDEHCIFRAVPNTDRNTPDYQDMFLSYVDTIEQVGGDPSNFINNINSMTVSEMMQILAPNGVRFVHELSHVNRREQSRGRDFDATL